MKTLTAILLLTGILFTTDAGILPIKNSQFCLDGEHFSKVELRTTERVQPYAGNPFYLAWGDTPVFPLGPTDYHAWTPVSRPGMVNFYGQLNRISQIINEIGSPHVVGFVRCMPYDPNYTDVIRVLQPWVRMEDGRYDLEQFEPEWERRLKDYLDLTLDLRIIVSMEVWDDWSISRTVRGDRRADPDRGWNAHPFNPRNNINYDHDILPEPEPPIISGGWGDLFDFNAPFYNTIPSKSDIAEVLALQKHYVDHLLDIISDYPNVLINISNESRADLEWSRFWAEYIRQRAPSMMIGEMPSTNMKDGGGVFEDIFNPMTLATDPHYDYVDISQAVSGHEFGRSPQTQAIEGSRRIAGYRAAMKEAGTERPLITSKDYTRDQEGGGAIVLWGRFVGGSASARFHRPNAGVHPESVVLFQHETVRHLGSFIARVPFWQMDIHPEVVNVTPPGAGANVLTDLENHYVIQLIGGGEGEKLGLQITPGKWNVTWIDPATGKDIVNYEISSGSAELELEIPSELDHRIVHLKRKAN